VIAAPGRVEPVSEEIEVGAEIAGKLKAVLVEEGDRVGRGKFLRPLRREESRSGRTKGSADRLAKYTN
jgi:hypothetical protein